MCYSGDYVKMDEDGFLYFVGRRDTMIKSSGFRISPTEVEEVLFQSGLVKGAAVIGVPDDVLGQSVKAFVVRAMADASGVDDAPRVLCARRCRGTWSRSRSRCSKAPEDAPAARWTTRPCAQREGL